MENPSLDRRKEFRWNTRQELYTYFKEIHEVDKLDVDKEIHRVTAIFRPRKGQHIHTYELWEKVGSDLERSLRKIETSSVNDKPETSVGEGAEDKVASGKDSSIVDKECLPPQPVIANEKSIDEKDKKRGDVEEDVAYFDK